jgi:metal-responsive CopG/Arc/MetJ family transcriptional regulator
MEPITLGLPTDLLEELDAESNEVGFSTRSAFSQGHKDSDSCC